VHSTLAADSNETVCFMQRYYRIPQFRDTLFCMGPRTLFQKDMAGLSPFGIGIEDSGDHLVLGVRESGEYQLRRRNIHTRQWSTATLSISASVIRIDPDTGGQTLLSQGGALERPIGVAVFRGPIPGEHCTMNQSAKLERGTLTLRHEVGATRYANWRVLAFAQGTKYTLRDEELLVTDPPEFRETLALDDVPNVGWVFFLSGIVRVDGVGCWDLDAVFTGAPAAD
jgi:hypothetical protein